MKKPLNILAALMVGVLVPAIGLAQRGPGGGPEGGGGPGGPGAPPPGGGGGGGRAGRGGGGAGGTVAGLTSALTAIAELQGELKATNEEWLVVGPRLQKLIIARQAAEGIASGGAGTGGGGGGRGGGAGGNDTFGGPSPLATGGRGGGGRGARGGAAAPGGPAGPGAPGGVNGPGPNGPNGSDPRGNAPPSQRGNPPVNSAPPLAPAATDAAPAAGQTEGTIQIITLPQALTDLQTALNEPSTSERQLKDLLAIVRAARAKAAAEVKAANEDLQHVLTADQIALLVSYGYLQ